MTPLLGLGLVLVALLGAPLFGVLAAGALWGYSSNDIMHANFIVEVYRLTSAPALLALPLFVLAGSIFAHSKAPERLVRLTEALVGWIPGGLSIVTVVTFALFTAFTGASGVTIVALGGLLMPALTKQGYPQRFNLGLLTTSGSIGLLFAPSLPVILYGLVAEAPIDKLFLAGLVPGMLLVLSMSGYGAWSATRAGIPRGAVSGVEVWSALRQSAWEIPLPILVLVGIYGGFITAPEAGAITAFYALVVEVLILRDIHWKNELPAVFRESVVLMGGLLIILASALGLTNFLVDQEVPMKILDAMKGMLSTKISFLLVLNVFLLIVGCLMDIFSAIMVVVPLIVPVAAEFGVDPVHLGIIFLVNLEIGYSTPPVGINLFLSAMRFKKPVLDIYKSIPPFLALQIAVLLLVTYVPEISLWWK